MDETRKNVSLFGVTGVGKTTLTKGFIARHAGWIRVSGGDMIMKTLGQLPEEERDKLRDVDGRSSRRNQRLILQNFRQTWAETTENILFDGQCAVRAADGALRPIPAIVTVGMGVTKVIYLEVPPGEILLRREKDKQRPDREVETLDELIARMVVSQEICRRYAEKAGVPFVHLSSPTEDEFAEAVLG